MKTSSGKIKIIIADDHAIARQGVRMIISQAADMEIVGEAENGNDALRQIQKLDVDVLIMDIEMPEKSGWDALLEIQSIRPKLPVLILSIFPEDHYGTRFLKAGAAGYLSKASTPDEVVEAIRRVHRGGKYVSQNLAEKLVTDLTHDTDKPLHETLSDREFQVFQLIASGKKLSEIADQLALGVTTVSSYRSRIFEKMNFKTNTDLIHYALKNKLISH